MTKFKLLILVLISTACSKQECDFLNKFENSETGKTLYTKPISATNIDILMATNEINPSNFNAEHKYFYGFRKKLDNEHFLISYSDTYSPHYRFTNKLVGWEDIFYCIYNTEQKQVVSKLKVSSSDPVLSYFKKIGNRYIIKSSFFKFIPKESECNNIVIQRDSTSIEYKIQNNKFVEIVE
ncbi:hypothetical protein HYN48_13870 [Flavobacterium magnum]|uniref:Lipoprotein n=1 Tax=Flavobacterium magnum TaxID=2162713 RepID=A0A2S0RHE9_9FLAO|nr:hypothetical protein [Flavobacterium magnum]AWA31086.1 hypothetical protein HYN48_13870 [Flavobacterium magnum]